MQVQPTYIEIGTGAIVRVVRIQGRVAILDGGTQAWLSSLYRPAWLVEAEQALADARAERATVEDVRYGG